MSITKHAKAARTEPTSLFKTALLLCSLAMTIGLLFSAVQDARGAGHRALPTPRARLWAL